MYRGSILHTRTEPIRHIFRYPAAFVAVELAALQASPSGWRLGYNRKGFLEIRDRDYLARDDRPIAEKLAAAMPGFDHSRTVMLTMPRTPMTSFNPLTGYFARDETGAVTGFAAEVANTYGERYFYNLQPARSADGRLTARAPKVLYVSPFHGVQGLYRFSASLAPEFAELSVDLEVNGRVLIAARLSGHGKPLDKASVLDLTRVGLSGALALPRIVGQALRLRGKGLQPVMKPRPPSDVLRKRSGK